MSCLNNCNILYLISLLITLCVFCNHLGIQNCNKLIAQFYRCGTYIVVIQDRWMDIGQDIVLYCVYVWRNRNLVIRICVFVFGFVRFMVILCCIFTVFDLPFQPTLLCSSFIFLFVGPLSILFLFANFPLYFLLYLSYCLLTSLCLLFFNISLCCSSYESPLLFLFFYFSLLFHQLIQFHILLYFSCVS